MDIEGGGGGGDAHTVTEHENLGSRLQGACAGICVGLLLFLGSFPLLFWNEGRAVDRYDALNEAKGQTFSILDPTAPPDPANEGKLLHFSANTTNGGDALIDATFGIESSSVECLTLRRNAEMYQWIERVETTSKKKVGGGKTTTKTYTYHKEWVDGLIDSNMFQQSDNHVNPSSMEFESMQVTANPISIGAYELPRELVHRINWETRMGVEIADISNESIRKRAKIDNLELYFGNSVFNPQIGDQTVSFAEAMPSVVTIVGVQSGNTLAPFVSQSGEGGKILLFQQGTHSAKSMYEGAEGENAVLTWVLRLVGFVAMTLGLYLIFQPVEVFADIVPCVGSIVGCGIIFVSVLISAILSAITISFSWLVAHPTIGAIVLGVMFAVIGCCAFGVKQLEGRKGKEEDHSLPSTHPGRVAAEILPTADPIPIAKAVHAPEPTILYTAPEPYVPGT